MQIACRSVQVDPERIDQMIRSSVSSTGESGSRPAISETAVAHLRRLDDVAYVRFASVHRRNFREAKDFETGARRVSGDEAAEIARK